MHILLLTLLFAFTGVMAIVFHRIVPDGAIIRKRFPLRSAQPENIVLPLVILAIGVIMWFNIQPDSRITVFTSFIIGLLALESGLLLMMRKFQSTIILSGFATLCGIGAFALSWKFQLPALDMLLFVFGTLGAWTLAQRLGFISVPFLMIVVLGLTAFDYIHVKSLTNTVTPSATAAGASNFFLVSIGNEALGIGDFIFLSLCTLALITKFGSVTALLFLAIESLILLATGFIPTTTGFFFPYLLVMTPVFLLVYFIAWIQRKRALRSNAIAT